MLTERKSLLWISPILWLKRCMILFYFILDHGFYIKTRGEIVVQSCSLSRDSGNFNLARQPIYGLSRILGTDRVTNNVALLLLKIENDSP